MDCRQVNRSQHRYRTTPLRARHSSRPRLLTPPGGRRCAGWSSKRRRSSDYAPRERDRRDPLLRPDQIRDRVTAGRRDSGGEIHSYGGFLPQSHALNNQTADPPHPNQRRSLASRRTTSRRTTSPRDDDGDRNGDEAARGSQMRAQSGSEAALPDDRHVVLLQAVVLGDDRRALGAGLRDQDAIKRVAMMPRQRLDGCRVIELYRLRDRALSAAIGRRRRSASAQSRPGRAACRANA
jgi:hypothetical protein